VVKLIYLTLVNCWRNFHHTINLPNLIQSQKSNQMKTRLIFLVLFIVCFSCGTNNKPVSDAQKEKIKGEVKEVVNTFIKGCEELNFDMAIEPFLDSPDFEYAANGKTYNYQELIAMRPLFDEMINQKLTIADEKYKVLDNSTVLFTTNYKWLQNYKDGHSILEDPGSFMFMFKKINNKWRIIYWADSYVEKNVPSESSKGLNHVELEKQFIGTWKAEAGKDTVLTIEVKPFYNGGFVTNLKTETKGKIIMQEMSLLGYDKNADKLIESAITNSSPEIILMAGWFISANKMVEVPLENISNPDNAAFRWIFEFKSHDLVEWTEILNNKETKIYTLNRIK